MEKTIENSAFRPFIRNIGGESVVELGCTLKYHGSFFILAQKDGNLAHLRNPAISLGYMSGIPVSNLESNCGKHSASSQYIIALPQNLTGKQPEASRYRLL